MKQASSLAKLTAGGSSVGMIAVVFWMVEKFPMKDDVASKVETEALRQRVEVVERRLDVWIESERRKYE